LAVVEYALLLSNLFGGFTGTLSNLLATTVGLLTANPILLLALVVTIVAIVLLRG
jgi:hypothetical protein